MKSLLLLAALASVVGAGLHRHRRHVDTADWLNGEEHSPTFVSMDRDGSKYDLCNHFHLTFSTKSRCNLN